LRHSFFSHLVGAEGSLEGGNTESISRRHYLNLATTGEAQGFGRSFRRAPARDGRSWRCAHDSAAIGVDLQAFVRHYRITMKTATVRDLRNKFADVAKWIEHGEAVTITRNGTAFATLAPAKASKPRRVDWAARLAKRKPLGRKLSKAETEAFWSRLRD
jgi:antitoxin (DNA-binding transcriptional repressor) of toxin-antitoxin stability system